MAAIGDVLRSDLREPEFSEGYAESFLDTYIATQLKVLREQNGWSQTQLAEKMGKKQTVVSRSENVNYSSWNIKTLKQYARAFRLRLRVSFETYGSLIDEVQRFSKEDLQRVPREADPDLADSTLESEESVRAELPERMPESSAVGTTNTINLRPPHRQCAKLIPFRPQTERRHHSASDLLAGHAQTQEA